MYSTTETGTCTTFISGNWSGYLLDDNDHAINLNITASFSSDRQNVRLVDKDGIIYEGRIQCDTSLRSLSIPGSEPHGKLARVLFRYNLSLAYSENELDQSRNI